jgi:hypothetical protein
MWMTKTWKTKEAMEKWIENNGHRYQMETIFVNNAYGLLIRKLRVIG